MAGRVWRSEFEGIKLDVDGCVIANWVKVSNCPFYNMGKIATYDLGNGRVFECRNSEIKLFSLTNRTFANNIDRIICHRGGSGFMHKVIMDHCISESR